MTGVLPWAISGLLLSAAALWNIAFFRLAPRLRLIKENFNKQPIIASYGIVAVPWVAAVVCSLALIGLAQWREVVFCLSVMSPMWVLGIADDIFGTRKVGGFRGHFGKLFRERKLGTGVLKAVGGGVVGLAAAWAIYGFGDARWIPAALVIPLAANTLNLVDLRPGRALAVFLAGLGVTWLVAPGGLESPWLAAGLAAVGLAFAYIDCRATAMMGDSGSNALGAALGLMMALELGPVAQIVAIVMMGGVQLYSERHSLSELIERNRVLRAIDRRLGVR